MAENEQTDIPDRLKRLPRVEAPERFALLLQEQIKSLPPRGTISTWFLRPVPVALVVAAGALAVAVFVIIPYVTVSPIIPQDGAISVPLEPRIEHVSTPNPPGRVGLSVPVTADTLVADSALPKEKDVNTSKMP